MHSARENLGSDRQPYGPKSRETKRGQSMLSAPLTGISAFNCLRLPSPSDLDNGTSWANFKGVTRVGLPMPGG